MDHSPRVLGLDPGTRQSAIVTLHGETIGQRTILPNEDVLAFLFDYEICNDVMFIEGLQSYGMPVGKETFETAIWIGRFIGLWHDRCGSNYRIAFRKDIVKHHTGKRNNKDRHIHAAMVQRYGSKGTKKSPGPTFGFHDDMWSALAIASYGIDMIGAAVG